MKYPHKESRTEKDDEYEGSNDKMNVLTGGMTEIPCNAGLANSFEAQYNMTKSLKFYASWRGLHQAEHIEVR